VFVVLLAVDMCPSGSRDKQFSGCDLLCIGNVRKCRQTKQQQNSELLRLQESVTALQLERDRLKSETAQKVLSTMV